MSHDPADLVRALRDEGVTLAVAESLTGGRVAASLTSVPGASAVFRGGVVAYASEVKVAVLGVGADLVEQYGVVSPECAIAMAEGVRRLLGADIGLSTTGVAGPDRQEDKPVGTVYIGIAAGDDLTAVPLNLAGDRPTIQATVVERAIAAATARCRELRRRDPAG